MARRGLPRLSESVRFYVENTVRARVRGPAVEGYRLRRPSPWPRVLAALLALAALALAFRWLALP